MKYIIFLGSFISQMVLVSANIAECGAVRTYNTTVTAAHAECC